MDNQKVLMDEAIFIQLLIFVIFIALCLFSLNRCLENFDFNAMLMFDCLIAQTIFNSVFGYFSDNVKERSEQIGRITYNLRWYEIPLKQREFIRFMIQRAQKPFIITGARLFPSSMATIASVSSYQVNFR